MNRLMAMFAFCVAATLCQTADAGSYCGAGSYNCCPTTACAPMSCYTTCRIERQTCKRTVMETVWEPEEVKATRTLSKAAGDKFEVARRRTGVGTAYGEHEYEVRDPDREKA